MGFPGFMSALNNSVLIPDYEWARMNNSVSLEGMESQKTSVAFAILPSQESGSASLSDCAR